MRRSIILAALLVVIPAPALAEGLPDMLGVWSGTTRSVVGGPGGHFGEDDIVQRFAEIELTIEWTEQDDDRLIGTITSANGPEEPKFAVLSNDGQTLVTVDSDGASVGRLIDADHFELCYMQSSFGDQQMVASCVEFARAGG